jgi:hypothetical protein
MARPTEEKKEKTIKLRISEELYGEIASKGRNLSETIREILRNSFVPQNSGEKNQKSGLTPSKEVKEIESMAVFFGFTLDEMLKMIYNGLNDGYLTVEDGKIVGLPEVNLDNLKEACHERGIGMQEAIDKTIKILRSGK